MPSGRILIVDDSRSIRTQMAHVLGQAGHVAVTGRSVDEALAALDAEDTFDLLITDLGMPDRDGFDLVTEVRQSRWDALPILVHTSEPTPTDMVRAKRLGANGWLKKPVPNAHLLAIAARVG